jgi:hypothetical protein
MTIGTKECKQAIVQYCMSHKDEICRQFIPLLDDEGWEQTTRVGNWKRERKSGTDIILREFDCRPLDSQLRGYVWSIGEKITRVLVQGE